MEILKIEPKNNIKIKENLVACLGFFDGLHLGHQSLIKETILQAKKNKYKALFFTFSQLPKAIISKKFGDNFILSVEEKAKIIKKFGFDYFAIFNFNDQTRKTTFTAFINILLNLNIKIIIVGSDFRFGYQGTGTINDLKKYFHVIIKPQIMIGKEKISTTYIKKLLLNHQIELANKLLFAPFSIKSKVQSGNQWGREINFPTINFHLDSNFAILPQGVYVTTLYIDNKKYYGLTCIFVTNKVLKCETHILNYRGNLYDQYLRIYFHHYLRANVEIKSLKQLQKLILIDQENMLNYLKKHSNI